MCVLLHNSIISIFSKPRPTTSSKEREFIFHWDRDLGLLSPPRAYRLPRLPLIGWSIQVRCGRHVLGINSRCLQNNFSSHTQSLTEPYRGNSYSCQHTTKTNRTTRTYLPNSHDHLKTNTCHMSIATVTHTHIHPYPAQASVLT